MRTKPEIKEKLEEAKTTGVTKDSREFVRLSGVVSALCWVLDQKITTEPKDPVSEE